jgi:long-chain fatty acid transport protein
MGRRAAALIGVGVAMTSSASFAGHGLNVIGFGAESLGMAGTDLAVARDSAAVNINPAGLTQLDSRTVDVYFSPFYTARMSHTDAFGNERTRPDNPLGATAGFSVAQPLMRYPDLVVGAGLFVQGGTGFLYEDLNTAFGTRDELSSLFSVFKLASGFGWKASKKLRVGATLGLSYAQARQQLFPATSDSASNFFGIRFDGGQSLAESIILGLQYKLRPDVTLGLGYTSQLDLDLDKATLTANYESLGYGRVRYRDARLDGFALPQTFGVSAAWQPRPEWLLAVEVEWVDWSRALSTSRLRASRPDAEVPEQLLKLDQSTPLNWRDQYALSFGLAWNLAPGHLMRAGVDYVRNPVPRRTMSPLFNIIQEPEFTFGYGRRLASGRMLDFVFQWQLPNRVTYTNPDLPFGENARATYEVVIFNVALGFR